MNDHGVFADPCAICRVRKAVRWCDFVINYDRNIIFFRNYKDFKEANEATRHETCDLPLCEKCSHEKNKADFCPHHYHLLQQVELPKHLKGAQARVKGKIYSGLIGRERDGN